MVTLILKNPQKYYKRQTSTSKNLEIWGWGWGSSNFEVTDTNPNGDILAPKSTHFNEAPDQTNRFSFFLPACMLLFKTWFLFLGGLRSRCLLILLTPRWRWPRRRRQREIWVGSKTSSRSWQGIVERVISSTSPCWRG